MAAQKRHKPIFATSLPTLVGPKELSKILACSIITLRRWDAAGVLPPAIRVGPQQHRRWRKADIDNWIAALPRKAVANA
jgi:predicted DNA-binding transcriptional regulator AlpA